MSSTARRTERRYTLYGFTIASELDLPELFECSPTSEPDIEIRLGTIPHVEAARSIVHETEGGALLKIDGCARFLVSSGCRILIEPEKGASARNVRLFLLGSAFGLLLHQRKLLPLHGNSVELQDGVAVTFVGPSGIGKSTLAAWFHDNGRRIIADDVSVVEFAGAGVPVVLPGLPRLRLWEEVMIATGRDPSDFPLSFERDEQYKKRDVKIGSPSVATQAIPLSGIVLLTEGTSALEQLHGVHAADVLFSNTYRGEYVELADTVRDHWVACTTLAISIPVFKVGLRRGLFRLHAACSDLVSELHSALRMASLKDEFGRHAPQSG